MSSVSAVRVAVLMTCFNRRALTEACLDSLRAQTGPEALDLFLVDDGSRDGTGDMVRAAWPGACVIEGTGALFWNGGMNLAWECAAAHGGYDHFLWLNDDVILRPDAVARLVRTAAVCANPAGEAIVCGSTADPASGALTYGGQVRPNPRRPLRMRLVEPGEEPRPAETVSGNIVLVSAAAYARLGRLSPAFGHIFGDLDYGLRASAAGVPVVVGAGWFGTCAGPDMRGTSLDPALGRMARLRLRLGEERKHHARDWRTFARRHAGLGALSVAYTLPPYWRILRTPRRRGGGAAPILVFAPNSIGGLAEHVHYQANELAARGHAVEMLCRDDFLKPQATAAYRQRRTLGRTVAGTGIGARLVRAVLTIVDRYALAWRIAQLRPAFVLLDANSEFYAPAWFLPHWLLHRAGTIYVTNFHDPVRGPAGGIGRALHGISIRLAYASLDGGLIHGAPPPGAFLPARLVIREAPFGPFTDLAAAAPAFDLRARLGIARDAFVLLAFGHVADRKNLDLAIAALAEVAGAHLVVAGKAMSAGDRPLDFYRALARQHGVADRVHFVDGFIAEADISAYFAAADAVALTYTRGFVSQSGVLQIAALWDKPLLASGGAGPLRETVERFGLGLTIAPDSAVAIAAGLERLIAEPADLAPAFAAYRATTSWAVNVDRLLEVVGEVERERSGVAPTLEEQC